MLVHACKSITREAERWTCCECKVSLGYTEFQASLG